MDNTSILDRTKKLIDEAPLNGDSLDTKVLNLLRQEYLRHFSQYRRTDLLMQKKYGFSFDEFLSQRIVKKKQYSWDVETDAMNWETAISGMKTMERKLEELKKEECV